MVFQVHLSLRFFHQMPAQIYLLSLACHTTRSSFLLSILNARLTKIEPNTGCSLLTGSFYPQNCFERGCCLSVSPLAAA